MGLVLEEFYRTLRTVGVSAVSGEGVDELFEAIHSAADEYHEVYRPMMEAKVAEKKKKEEQAAKRRLAKVASPAHLDVQNSRTIIIIKIVITFCSTRTRETQAYASSPPRLPQVTRRAWTARCSSLTPLRVSSTCHRGSSKATRAKTKSF